MNVAACYCVVLAGPVLGVARLGDGVGSSVPAIVRAAEAGDVAAVRGFVLLDSGAVRRVDGRGNTALHFAASRDHAEVISVLAAAGADLEATDRKFCPGPREMPRCSAAWELLRCRGWRALHQAAEWGYAAALQRLLELRATVAPKDSDGETPLHFAARRGKAAVAQLLLAANAPLDSRNDKGGDLEWDDGLMQDVFGRGS
eukprot:Skav205228  [mRNA]  locus=scaffold1794:63357:66615:+ [translate_table: standard]